MTKEELGSDHMWGSGGVTQRRQARNAAMDEAWLNYTRLYRAGE